MLRRFASSIGPAAASVALTALVATLTAGCAGPTPYYTGPRRAPSEVAIIGADARVKIIEIDGRKKNGGTYEVLPGEHQVHVKITFLGDEISTGLQGLRETCYANAKFIADAGQEYRVMRISKQGKMKNVAVGIGYTHDWGVELTNLTTGERLDDAMSEMSCGG